MLCLNLNASPKCFATSSLTDEPVPESARRSKMGRMNVQIFGTQKSRDTKKALRFFKERGIKPQFVDLSAGKTAPGELKRFVQRVGVDGLIEKDSRVYGDSGLAYLRLSDDELLTRLLAAPALLKQPLLRSGNAAEIGWNEPLWRELYAANREKSSSR